MVDRRARLQPSLWLVREYTVRPRIERVRDASNARWRLVERGRENMPFDICSCTGGSCARQWPSSYLHRSTSGNGFATSGGKTSLSTGCVGTGSRFPNAASWYGMRHATSRGREGQGVMTMVGIDGSSFAMTCGWSGFYDCAVQGCEPRSCGGGIRRKDTP